MGDASAFTNLDCNSGYWQIPVAPQDRDKTTFNCHAGTYRYRRMPFGLTNAPATFQRTLDIVLNSFKWQSCLVYLEDVIIFSKDMESHFAHVEEILKALCQAGITLKPSKCSFFTHTVKYLGHVIKPGTLQVDEVATMALKKASSPKTQTQLRSFLGLCNVYRRFLPRYSHVAAPLNAFLTKGQPVNLEPFREGEANALNEPFEAITSQLALGLPETGLPWEVDTNASGY